MGDCPLWGTCMLHNMRLTQSRIERPASNVNIDSVSCSYEHISNLPHREPIATTDRLISSCVWRVKTARTWCLLHVRLDEWIGFEVEDLKQCQQMCSRSDTQARYQMKRGEYHPMSVSIMGVVLGIKQRLRGASLWRARQYLAAWQYRQGAHQHVARAGFPSIT
jgi:hypothetical protein